MKMMIRLFGLLQFCCLLALSASGQVNITTERYDNSRTGANLNETVLTTSSVNATQFGKLYSYSVSGSVQAQPLYVANLTLPGLGVHNVLFVATMNDIIYALDADSNTTHGGVLWSVNFTNPANGVTPIPIADIVGQNNLNIVGNVGIESTPVIDLTSNTVYLVARTKEVVGSNTNYVARLHALDITTGAEKFGGPVIIHGSVPGTGQGSSGGILTFDPFIQNQRSSLVLVNGLVVFSWASHEDDWAWHGWIFAYNAQTLLQSSVFCSTPNGQNGGMWMSGRAPVIDSSGNLYYATGNGDWDGVTSYGDTVLKMGTSGGTLSRPRLFHAGRLRHLASRRCRSWFVRPSSDSWNQFIGSRRQRIRSLRDEHHKTGTRAIWQQSNCSALPHNWRRDSRGPGFLESDFRRRPHALFLAREHQSSGLCLQRFDF